MTPRLPPKPLVPTAAEQAWPCLRAGPDESSLLDLSVSPNARLTEAQGLHDGALRVRLAAPPVDGQANACLLRWLAAELGLAQRQVNLLRGETTRRKQVRLDAPPVDVAAWLARLLPAGAADPD